MTGHPWEQPQNDLPIAPYPAMLAAAVGTDVRRIIVDDFHVGDQTCARIGALNQVVTQNGVARESVVQNPFERLYLVDPFPRENPLPEQVLIDVGNGSRIDVESSVSR